MADYSTIKGFTVQTLSSDPYATEVLGATWASGTDFPSTTVWGAGFGIQTAAVYGFGLDNPGAYVRTTFEYDGTTWAGPATVNRATGAACAGLGTQTAGLIAGGTTTPPNAVVTLTETYDGSSWSTSPGTLNTARTNPKGTGTTTAGIIFGGTTGLGSGPTQPAMNNTETWNGSAWTETNDMNTARNNPFSLGTTNPASTAVAAGGQTGATLITDAETWDGTSWSQVNDINTGRAAGGGASSSNTTGIIFGGKGPVPTANALTESWDGTSWTEVADLATARLVVVGTGTATSGFAIGGQTASAKIAGTEEFSAPAATVIAGEGQVWYNSSSQVLKSFGQQGTGAWAAGGTLNTGRNAGGAAGSSTAGLVIAGQITEPPTANCESYDGTSWTEIANTPTNIRYNVGFGSQTAAVTGGGHTPAGNYGALNYTWNATSWTANNAMNTGRAAMGGTGTSTAGIIMAGITSPSDKQDITETFDGTTWTEVADLNTAMAYSSAGGSQTAALRVFGSVPPSTIPPNQKTVEEWNGTSWTEVNDLNQARNSTSSASKDGTTSAMFVWGGSSPATPADTVNCEQYNGTSWTEVGNLALGRSQGFGSGTTMNAFTTGGSSVSSDALTSTEIWSTPNAIKTFTAS